MRVTNILKLLTVFIVVVVLFGFKKDPSVGKVTFPIGNVLVIGKGETKYRTVTYNMAVKNGDKIETKKEARCEITFNDGSVARIDEQTIYTIDKAEIKAEKKEVQSSLSLGKLWANVKKLVKGKDSWRLRSPAAVVAVRGTIYRMNAGADSSSQVLVYDGNVAVSPAQPAGMQQGMGGLKGKPTEVQGPVQVQGPREVTVEEWVEIVKAQQQIIVRPDGSYAKSDFNLEDDAKLDWVKWNKERDELLEQR